MSIMITIHLLSLVSTNSNFVGTRARRRQNSPFSLFVVAFTSSRLQRQVACI